MDDSVVRILRHGVACAEFRSVLHSDLASRCVLVFEVPRHSHSREQPVIWQELESCGFDMRCESVQLDAVLVVNVDVFALRDSDMV